MAKIQRNDPCACKSGKKYKNCCGGNNVSQLAAPEIDFAKFLKEFDEKIQKQEKVDAVSFFKKYNTPDLLLNLALIQVLPENHGNNLRIEELQRQALLSSNSSQELIDIDELKKFVHEKFPHHHMEDPPENLFTENIMTPLGNHIVFPGITDGQLYSLQHFIRVLINPNCMFPEIFVNETLDTLLLLFTLSNQIARGFGYQRNMCPEFNESNDIYFQTKEFVEEKKHYLFYSKEEISQLKRDLNLKNASLSHFVLYDEDEKLKKANNYTNPIIFKPIIESNNCYLILSPTNLIFAATRFVIAKAIENNCIKPFINEFSLHAISSCSYMLNEMGYRQIDFEFGNTDLSMHEGLFLFDYNKIAYITLEYDNAENFNLDNPLIPEIDKKLENKVNQRKKEIGLRIKQDNRFIDHNFFHINILMGIGRPRANYFKPPDETWLSLGLSFSDLLILYKSDKCHNLTLWNFCLTLNEYTLTTPFFLDNISYYIENDETFYTSDDKISSLYVGVGNALTFKRDAIQRFDEHLAVFPGSSYLIPIAREDFPANLPVYSTRNFPSMSFKVCTPSLGNTLWILPVNEFEKAQNTQQKFLLEICISIAYWINELASELNTYLPINEFKIILIKLNAVEIGNAFDAFSKLDKSKELISQIEYTINDNVININLNEYFFYWLYREDNIAERILMKKIIYSLKQMLLQKQKDIDLSDDLIDQIIDKVMPVGQKKRLLMQIQDHDIRISPDNVTQVRNINRYEVNRQLDNLGVKLSSAPYTPRTIPNDERSKLVNKVVINFYEGLRALLNEFDNQDVLDKLLRLQESAIQKRELFKFESSPKIECFKNHCDIVKKLSEENKDNSNLSLSLRCLIEHIVAEPLSGIKKIDLESFDKAVAFMYNIVNWGFVSDELNFKVADIEISLLASGRVGTGKDFFDEIIKPFYNSKFLEDLSNTSDKFGKKFHVLEKHEHVKTDVDEIELPFKEEFQMTLDDFLFLADTATHMAFTTPKSIYKNTLDEFINEIKNSTNIDEDLVRKFVELFSLYNRGKVENVSHLGFKNEEFYPWRYNRALSLLYKPLILTTIKDVTYISFGSRSVYDFKGHILYSIYSGRIKAKSDAMKSFVAKINKEKGGEFNSEVFNFIKSLNHFSKVERSVKIGPNGILVNKDDLGDFDILLIDDKNKKIIGIECKNTNTSRTPYEMYLELLSFLGKENNGWISKVNLREEWILNNKNSLKAVKDCDYLDYSFENIFLTKEVIPFGFIKDLDIKYRFVSFHDLQLNPIEIITNT